MKYRDLLDSAMKRSSELGKEESAVRLLLLDASKLENHILIASMNDEVSEEVVRKFDGMLDDYLINNIPVQQIVGYEYFFGYSFKVSSDVLIPRPETEELVANVLSLYDEFFSDQEVNVVDIGTGSGAIAITLALEEKNMSLSATDISKEALSVAKENSSRLCANVKFITGDMLRPLANQKFDILVSNPPYIPKTEVVDSLVYDNEPHVALFGGEDGLKFYREIIENASSILNEKSIIAFEHAYDKAKEIYEIAKSNFEDSEIRQIKDMQGKDRMTFIINGG